MITIAKPEVGDEEIRAVNEVLKSGMLAQGPKVAELEKAWAEYCGTKHALAVNSGTAAIHAALFAAGVQPGDEVITTPFSFIATINPIIMLGAKPVLVDIDKATFNIDATKIEAVITKKTKAIMPVHLYGQPADVSAIKDLAEKHDLKIIEDACQAIGSEYRGKKAGNLGSLGCFSLYATKNIMCGEGGMITTNDDEQAKLIRQFRQHGMSGSYQYEHLGYNYRLTDLQAAIAVEQLKKVDRFNKARQENARFFNEELKDVRGIITPKVHANRTHVYHQYTIIIEDTCNVTRDELAKNLKDKGVIAGVYYPQPLHHIEHIAKRTGYRVGDFPNTEDLAKRVISLPVHPGITPEDRQKITEIIKNMICN